MAPVKLSELPALLGRPYTSGPIKFSNVAIAGGQSGGSYTFSHFDGYSNLWSGLGATPYMIGDTVEQDVSHPFDDGYVATIHLVGDFQRSDTGIIYEAGGTGQGLIIYIYNNILYAQSGDGGGTGSASNRFECSYAISLGETIYDIVYTAISSGTDSAKLYVNGNLKDSDTGGAVSTLAGSNSAGWLAVYGSSVANNQAAWTSSSAGAIYSNPSAFLRGYNWTSFIS